MEDIKFKFRLCYTATDKIPKSIAESLISIMGYSRIGETARFKSYGLITFDEDDTKRLNPTFSCTEFNRLKTNGMLFELLPNNENKFYDKMIVYNSNRGGNSEPMYGYVLIDTKTNKMYNHVCIEYDNCELIKTLQSDFNLFNDIHKHSHIYNKKI